MRKSMRTRRGPGWRAFVGMVGCAAGLPAAFSAQAGPPPRAGLYESLLVAVGPDGSVTGYFHERLGSQPVRECAVFVAGRDGVVTAWTAGERGAIPGRLSEDADGVTLALPRIRDLPGCASVLDPEAGQGMTFGPSLVESWRELAVVAARRAPLYPSPAARRSRSYLVAGDVVGVTERVGGRLRVTYIDDDGRAVRGWLDAAGTQDVRPPGGP